MTAIPAPPPRRDPGTSGPRRQPLREQQLNGRAACQAVDGWLLGNRAPSGLAPLAPTYGAVTRGSSSVTPASPRSPHGPLIRHRTSLNLSPRVPSVTPRPRSSVTPRLDRGVRDAVEAGRRKPAHGCRPGDRGSWMADSGSGSGAWVEPRQRGRGTGGHHEPRAVGSPLGSRLRRPEGRADLVSSVGAMMGVEPGVKARLRGVGDRRRPWVREPVS
jgi:hypothetical protein